MPENLLASLICFLLALVCAWREDRTSNFIWLYIAAIFAALGFAFMVLGIPFYVS
jgi:hypothetical protein